MDLQQEQEMGLEMQLERIRRQLADMQATQDILVNYMQAVALSMGLKEKIKSWTLVSTRSVPAISRPRNLRTQSHDLQLRSSHRSLEHLEFGVGPHHRRCDPV